MIYGYGMVVGMVLTMALAHLEIKSLVRGHITYWKKTRANETLWEHKML